MEGCENVPARTSRLRPPSKISVTSQLLHELSESDGNARSMPPPNKVTLKRKASQQECGRTTLASRAAHFGSPNQSDTAGRQPVNGAMQASIVALSGIRNASTTSSNSSRIASPTSRNTSGTSTTSSMGRGRRTPSAQSAARTRSRNVASVPAGTPIHGSAANVYNPYTANPGTGKRLSTAFTSCAPVPSPADLRIQRQRRRHDNQTDNIYTSELNAPSVQPQQQAPLKERARELSVTVRMEHLSLSSEHKSLTDMKLDTSGDAKCTCTPSYIPKPENPSYIPKSENPSYIPKSETPTACLAPPSALTSRRSQKSLSPSKPSIVPFVNKWSNTRVASWDPKDRMEGMDQLFGSLKEEVETTTTAHTSWMQQFKLQQVKITELESIRSQLSTTNTGLQMNLDEARSKLAAVNLELQSVERAHISEVDDLQRKHRIEKEDLLNEQQREKEDLLEQQQRDTSQQQTQIEQTRRFAQDEMDKLSQVHRDDLAELELRMKKELDRKRTQLEQKIEDITEQLEMERQKAQSDATSKDREIENDKLRWKQLCSESDRVKALNIHLEVELSQKETSMQAMQAKITFLESDSQAQSQAFADLNRRMEEAIKSATETKAKLRAEETLRRKLHNQVQELKGNIRVFCRVRPMGDLYSDDAAKISFPDAANESKDLAIVGAEQKSALGHVTTAKNAFSFDRVFGPTSSNNEVFEEISQLVQSALDGYNVCIFCYGQTGSGKTYTMSAEDGMIPLAIHQIYETATGLEEKGWKYSMEGSFVEIYNENINDLLGKAEEIDKKKHEIRHDNQRCQTTITDVTTVVLDSPATVASLLQRATLNRRVAATKANERSSRSHTIFVLKLVGENSISGERSEGTLNLVDLAGSERVAHSGATGERLKEAQNINKSLSCLGDVIGALGQVKENAHIPYRNSKLTYLLQHSLGGNAKTLMFVMISPLQAHLNETLTSLKFATKVHNTHIGTAKRQTKVKD